MSQIISIGAEGSLCLCLHGLYPDFSVSILYLIILGDDQVLVAATIL